MSAAFRRIACIIRICTRNKPKHRAKTSVSNVLLALRPHLIAAMALFLVVTTMALSDDRAQRIALIAPAVLVFFAALVLYGLEYDAFCKSVASFHEKTRGKTLAQRLSLSQAPATPAKPIESMDSLPRKVSSDAMDYFEARASVSRA